MDDYYRMKHEHNLAKSVNRNKFQDNSKNRLISKIKKNFNTTMIGALAAFEEEFGELWGDGMGNEDLSPDQLDERERWERVRSKVLDNGNDQSRSAIEEISNHTISWNRFTTKFIVKKG